MWRNNIDPAKVLLGLGFYGRSFTLKDTTCTTPGCPFDKSAYEAGGATPGKCTGTSGILSNYEINRVLEQYSPDVIYSDEAAVNWITWNENQWYNTSHLIKTHEVAAKLTMSGFLSTMLKL